MVRRAGAVAVILTLLGLGIVLIGTGQSTVPASAASRTRSAHRPPSAKVSKRRGLATVNLAAGSDPAVLPGPVLIADRDNNRLVEVSPTGRVIWQFPRPGDLARGQTFRLPDDVFFSPDGKLAMVTQEDDFVITLISLTTDRIVYRYGHPGVSGSTPGYLDNPDDALLTRGGKIMLADIKNCRLLVIAPPAHRIVRQFGETGVCFHQPGVSYGSPNGAFPMQNGDTLVTEINGDWIDVLRPDGRVLGSVNAPSFSYPSDTNEVQPGVLLSADYASPGAIETFTPHGRLLWRYAPAGRRALDHPSLAMPLPNGDILANDDRDDRVIVINPRTHRIVWQYGHTHVAGRGPGYLANPDGLDLAPPYNLTARFR